MEKCDGGGLVLLCEADTRCNLFRSILRFREGRSQQRSLRSLDLLVAISLGALGWATSLFGVVSRTSGLDMRRWLPLHSGNSRGKTTPISSCTLVKMVPVQRWLRNLHVVFGQ